MLNTTPSESSRPCTPPPGRTAPRRAASTRTASPAHPAAPHPSPSGSAHPLPPPLAQRPLRGPRSPPSPPPPHRPAHPADDPAQTSPQSRAAPDTDRWSAPSLPSAAIATAQTNTWELGHPDAKLLLGIDLKSFRE